MPEPRLTPADAAEVDAFCRRSFRPATRNEIAMESRILDLLDANAAILARAEQAERVSAEGRAAGRMEAAKILLGTSAEDFPTVRLVRSRPIGDTGDYGTEWVDSEVIALFDAAGAPATKSLMESLEDAFWKMACDFESEKSRAEQAGAERDTLLDILERLHSVQDGCPLHKYNTVWVKAMEDAQAAFDRAGGGA